MCPVSAVGTPTLAVGPHPGSDPLPGRDTARHPLRGRGERGEGVAPYPRIPFRGKNAKKCLTNKFPYAMICHAFKNCGIAKR